MDARAITKALGGKWQGRFGLCCCPVHADRTPSLKVRDDARKNDGIDVHCFAGCDWKDIKSEFARHGFHHDMTIVVAHQPLRWRAIAKLNDQ